MTAITTFREFRDFYTDADEWPDGTWHDEVCIQVGDHVYDDDPNSGVGSESIDSLIAELEAAQPSIEDGTQVRIIGGSVMSGSSDTALALDTKFQRWRKRQNQRTFAVTVATDRLSDAQRVVTEALKANNIAFKF